MNWSFEDAWSEITARLMPGTLVRYWSAEEGYFGGAFPIKSVDNTAVTVPFGATSYERPIAKREFQRLFAFWHDYNRGTIGRNELVKEWTNAIYVLSILHWCDEARRTSPPPPLLSSVPILPQPGWSGADEYGKQVLLPT